MNTINKRQQDQQEEHIIKKQTKNPRLLPFVATKKQHQRQKQQHPKTRTHTQVVVLVLLLASSLSLIHI